MLNSLFTIKIVIPFIGFFYLIETARAEAFLSVATSDILRDYYVLNSSSVETDVNLKGSGVSVNFGYFLSNAIAFEIGYSSLNFETYEREITSPSLAVYEIRPQLDILQYGIRWFLFDAINFRVGGARFDANPKLRLTNPIANYKYDKFSETTSYYGGGVGLTFNKMQIFYDYTIFPSVEMENTKMSEIGIRVFF